MKFTNEKAGDKVNKVNSEGTKYKKIVFFSTRNLISFFLILIVVMAADSFLYGAASKLPEKLKIGLYFENTAVQCFTISAEKGIELGSFKDGSFTVLYSEPSNNPVTVRKDAYFVNTNGKLTPYDSNGKAIPEGVRLGPFHVQIGAGYADAASANAAVQDLKSKGVNAYPAFVDTWQVWTGFYTDQNTAQSDITGNIQPKIPGGVFNIVQPAANRIVAESHGDAVMVFGSDACRFQIHPVKGNEPYVFKLNDSNDLLYRGDLEVRRFTGSDMTLINIIPSEQYLYGVVPAEIGAGSSLEALKAQAVAARTYALNSLGKHDKWDFDLCTTTSCQVYKGFDGECANTNKAVDDTAGKIVTYSGKPAEIFYFSSSGGKTEDVKNVWGSDIPYLKSVEDKYESGKSWHYNWETSITADKVYSILKGRGYDLGSITSIDITRTAESGRVTELVVKGVKGQRIYTLEGCRTVFGLDSQWYTISTDADVFLKYSVNAPAKAQLSSKKVMTASGLKDLSAANGSKVTVLGADGQKKAVSALPASYIFTGKGWGHAVGMSQDGAMGMAEAGFKYDQILEHYFPGTKVE